MCGKGLQFGEYQSLWYVVLCASHAKLNIMMGLDVTHAQLHIIDEPELLLLLAI